MPRRSLILVLIAVVALAFGAGLAWMNGAFGPRAPSGAASQAAIGGPFQLVDQQGRPTDERILKGKWSAVFFGFTYCPDVCPTTLQTLALAQQELGAKAKDLQVVLISVDPERDTPEQIKTYLSTDGMPANAVGLTGTAEQVQGAVRAYRAYAEKSGAGEGYTVNHSNFTYLMDPQGRFHSLIRYGASPDEMARQISGAMDAR